MNGFQRGSFGGLGVTGDMVSSALTQILNWRDEVTCPHCSSAKVNQRFKHMGEFESRYCRYFWRVQ